MTDVAGHTSDHVAEQPWFSRVSEKMTRAKPQHGRNRWEQKLRVRYREDLFVIAVQVRLKLSEAEKLGIKIISEAEWIKLIDQV